jgi:radical SAM protein with 4Fe4S-binding SPASM domain
MSCDYMYPLLKGALRALEKKVLYDYHRDEQYELDDEAFEFLSYCTGRNSFADILRITGSGRKEARELLDVLVEEELVVDKYVASAPKRYKIAENISPSLRYLQLHITEKCNLDCRHCYLGRKGSKSLSLALAKKAVEEFSDVGLKLLITGGEPLLYPHFWELLRYARGFRIRIEVLSNGTLITREAAKKLACYADCVQISLDGLENGHDLIRGRGAFEKTMEGIKNALPHLEVSIATMIHSGNLDEFPRLEALVKTLGAKEWSLDVPSQKGNMLANKGLEANHELAAKIYKSYGYGSETHEGDSSYSCGSHLCSIDVKGRVTKCGFFSASVGNIRDTPLLECWRRVARRYLPRISELECASCDFVKECRGGCRYRATIAGGFHARDPFMCRLYEAG